MTVDFFPASLPPFASALQVARKCKAPSDMAALSATCQLSAIVAARRCAMGEWRDLRRLARHIDHSADRLRN